MNKHEKSFKKAKFPRLTLFGVEKEEIEESKKAKEKEGKTGKGNKAG